ncbi:hypothetical protein Bca52824_077818 [Brassica carinata]|uniref:Uncharacterized protein n=1 Tax=Brassica carinata TaxID=52824 RepID=A0A8X7TYJ3_BRACI|nr:hypothetical protein Bca52824_077818 [Brassica carinata]
MSTDLVPKPSSKDDSRAYKSGVAAENTTIPLKKSLLARNDSEAGANNNGVSNPNAADYQSTVRRSALFLCVEAFRGEASTMLQLRTQAIRALMKRWNIPHHNFEADLVPPTQQRVRKLAERFSTIEKQPFSCMCGQKFYAKSNLPTHKKKCLASKEEVDEEEDLAWAQKKRRSGGY